MGAADGQSVDFQGGLTDTDRHALAIFAAGANAAVQLHVITDHRYFGQNIRAPISPGPAV